MATVPLDSLKTFPGNARRGNVAAIKASLERRGQYKPLVISQDDVILAGNHTYLAAKELGWKSVTVTRLPMAHDTPDAREINIVDNRTADLGDYDNAALATLLSTINNAENAALGYTATDISDLLKLLEPPPEPPEPKARKYAGGTAPVRILQGDCIEVMNQMQPESIDAIVTDPPYGIGFMGKEWDDLPPGKDWAQACLRVLKPGGHIVAFGGTRTWHRLVVAIEDAGFEIRDNLAWLYATGFPKSLDISKAIDAQAGATRPVVGMARGIDSSQARLGFAGATYGGNNDPNFEYEVTVPATPEAWEWDGWGTGLKPCFEPVCLARKPFKTTVADNVLKHGTGALNIDGTRLEMSTEDREKFERGAQAWQEMSERKGQKLANGETRKPTSVYGDYGVKTNGTAHDEGRWPPNVLLDPALAAAVDAQSGETSSKRTLMPADPGEAKSTFGMPRDPGMRGHDDTGGASRFFYCPKASTAERPVSIDADGQTVMHETVKPLELMRWLVRLVTPPDGTVLDTFAGSGPTLEAARAEGFPSIGIEREHKYIELIKARFTDPPVQVG